MRSLGLTLCLLASSLGARAESAEDRVAALEARVRTLEQAMASHSGRDGIANQFTEVAAVSRQSADPDRKLTTGDSVETTNQQVTKQN